MGFIDYGYNIVHLPKTKEKDRLSLSMLICLSLASFLWDIGKQNSPRCEAAKRHSVSSQEMHRKIKYSRCPPPPPPTKKSGLILMIRMGTSGLIYLFDVHLLHKQFLSRHVSCFSMLCSSLDILCIKRKLTSYYFNC